VLIPTFFYSTVFTSYSTVPELYLYSCSFFLSTGTCSVVLVLRGSCRYYLSKSACTGTLYKYLHRSPGSGMSR
jgi:hypothetical protein